MKFLILGATGMAGHTISLYLTEQGHDVTGFSRQKVQFCKSIIGDVRNLNELENIIKEGKYDAVVNCIGILNTFAENNKELATFLNSYLPHFLASVTSKTETQIIQMSTDCVFSGEKGNYKESDFQDGKTFYDRTKALGELEDKKNITFRNSIVGPDLNPNGIGLLNWFMLQNDPIVGYDRVMWTGISTLQLAKAMEYATKEKASGLYNMVYKEKISKLELLKLFNRYMKKDSINISPISSPIVDKSLIRTNFNLEYIIPDYETMVIEMAMWMKMHKNLYPHYF
ncbi:dTDP-4-dehydrorhamnose reductase family protein [Planococcus soli]|uniref:dTDP-4-dehydrorhamnose reductase family protein n=1 Tax=Planococcus soli TaxID=2666072 RepID=UPI00115C91D8|nr:SDR family oxidoreductase [Planococcus soli]